MAAAPQPCPHCQRLFKRLRAHLPHCKAAPRPPPAPAESPGPAPASAPRPGPGPGPAPGTGTASGARRAPSPQPSPDPRPGPGTGTASGVASASAPGPSPQPVPDPRPAPGTGPGSGARPAPGAARGSGVAPARSGSRAVRDVARSLDLHPEEVRDVPRKLEKGVKVVIERHRARVVREKQPRSGEGTGSRGEGPGSRGEGPGSRGEGTEPARKSAQKSKHKESRSQGGAGSGAGRSEGEKSGLKVTKVLQEPPEGRNSPAELLRQEGRDKITAGEEQERLETGLGFKPPVFALHPKNLHLSLLGAHGLGTPKNELRRPRDRGEGVAEPLPSLHSPKMHPSCPCRASGSSAAGLEWIPDLYPDYEGLRIFPGKRFQEDLRIEAPRGGLALEQQGPLWERPLLEVRLGELHSWISTCSFTPQGLLAALQRAWSSYCGRYIHVRQGAPAGLSMLLAGSCLLSYGWNYQHFKQLRWRKYH